MAKTDKERYSQIQQKVAKQYNDKIHDLQAENLRLRGMLADSGIKVRELEDKITKLETAYARYKLMHPEEPKNSSQELINHVLASGNGTGLIFSEASRIVPTLFGDDD